MKKKDLLLITVILAVALLGWGGIQISSRMQIHKAVQQAQNIDTKPEEIQSEVATKGAAGQPKEEIQTEPETESSFSREQEDAQSREESSSDAENGSEGGTVPEYGIRITVNGEEFGRYSLEKDQVININSTNTVTIRDGAAVMTGAICPDHLCMYMQPIDGLYDLIVCLPNMVVVEGILMDGESTEPVIDGVS